MTGKKDKRVAEFWSWFQKEPGKWKKPGDDFDEQLLLPLYDALDETFPELTPSIVLTPGKGLELIFSLIRNRDDEERKRAVPLIHAIVAAAPKLKVWRFTTFEPKVAWMDAFLPQLKLPNGSTLAVETTKFELVSKKPLALRVFVAKYTKKKAEGFKIAVERMLEAGMGESFVVEDLAKLEIDDLKKAPSTAKPIEALSKLRL